MAYAGGFVGEQADEKNVGKSTFTNCYTANCTVTAKTDETTGLSFAGGFVGEVTRNVLTVENCYVYGATLSTAGSLAQTVLQKIGVFAGDLWNGRPTIDATNCYFGACGTTENAGAAAEKTEEEFGVFYCKDITHLDWGVIMERCPALIAETYMKVMEILTERGIIEV